MTTSIAWVVVCGHPVETGGVVGERWLDHFLDELQRRAADQHGGPGCTGALSRSRSGTPAVTMPDGAAVSLEITCDQGLQAPNVATPGESQVVSRAQAAGVAQP
jgi:hypothetical protein